jgi:uncharacterized protein YecT (DUF1311 family)
MMKFLGIVMALVGMTSVTWADDKIDCENGPQSELNMCAYQDYRKADDALNALWPKIKKFTQESDASYEADEKGYYDALLASQRGWLAYRDGQCELYGFQSHGGTMEPMLVSTCKADLTTQRVKELEGIMESGQ